MGGEGTLRQKEGRKSWNYKGKLGGLWVERKTKWGKGVELVPDGNQGNLAERA